MGGQNDNFPERFRKPERLKNKRSIQELFTSGNQVRFFPFVIYYKKSKAKESSCHQVLFSVPKKHFRKAVVRNKIRRKIREAYRRNKSILYNKYTGLPFLLGYVYISKNIPEYKEVEAGVIASLKYLTELKNH